MGGGRSRRGLERRARALERRIHDQTSQTLKDALSEKFFAAIYAAGQSITLTDAATYALGEPLPRVAA